MKLFKDKDEAKEWLFLNIPFAVKPKNKAKTMLVNPFTSINSRDIIIDALADSFIEFQEQKTKATNKDL